MGRLPIVRVFCMCEYYLPGYKSGGPVRTIAALVSRLQDHVHFSILTRDRDLSDTEPYPHITNDTWTDVSGASVYYTRTSAGYISTLLKLLKAGDYDVLYLNSFFSFYFSLLPLFLRRIGLIRKIPVILAPRGEFSTGAITLKAEKKAMAIYLAKKAGLLKDVTWQASSIHEADDIKRVFGQKQALNIQVALDLALPGSKTAGDADRRRSPDGVLRICFLSRISPKKNLEFALSVLQKTTVGIKFDIYGPIEDNEYWTECTRRIAAMGNNVQVAYKGEVENSGVVDVFGSYDLFFFPTKGENFGHVILESMYAGTPVLISDQTPWRNLTAKGAGWDLPLNNDMAFVQVLESMTTASEEEWISMRKATQEYAEKRLDDTSDIEANRRLFQMAAGNRFN